MFARLQIFYPDLIDKSQAPTYRLLRDPMSPDGATCIIRFHAGPPYEVRKKYPGRPRGGRGPHARRASAERERALGPPSPQDLAFRIVNHEWEMSHRRGFRCTFDRGILYLHFRFTRYRYRK